jgi:hypothetical protein
MASKLILHNKKAGTVIVTGANIDGHVYKKRILEGFRPIGKVNGINIVTYDLKSTYSDDKVIIDTTNNILSTVKNNPDNYLDRALSLITSLEDICKNIASKEILKEIEDLFADVQK